MTRCLEKQVDIPNRKRETKYTKRNESSHVYAEKKRSGQLTWTQKVNIFFKINKKCGDWWGGGDVSLFSMTGQTGSSVSAETPRAVFQASLFARLFVVCRGCNFSAAPRRSYLSGWVFVFFWGTLLIPCVLRATCLSLPLHTTAITGAHLPARTRPFISASLRHNGPEVAELPQNQFNFSQPCPPKLISASSP